MAASPEHFTETQRIPVVGSYSLESSILIGRLKLGSPGDEVTDAELTALVGKSTAVGGDAYGNLRTAIKHVFKQHAVLWKRVPGEGRLRCLDAVERLDFVDAKMRHQRRTAREGVLALSQIDDADLPAEQAVRKSVLAAIALCSAQILDPTTRKALTEGHAVHAPEKSKLLGLFSANGK